MDPQRAEGKVLWHFTMSLDGFVAGPEHDMAWMAGTEFRPGLVDDGIRLYDMPGGAPIRLHPTAAVDVRFRPVA